MKLSEKVYICFCPRKNERKRLATRQSSSHFQYRQLPEGYCSVNIITCATDTFKALLENNTERKEPMKILEELYYGNIRPDVKFYGKYSPFVELARLREKNRENFLEHLSEKEKETFEKFNDAQSEMDDITHYQKFTYGFRLGVLLMAEVFIGKDDLVDSYE